MQIAYIGGERGHVAAVGAQSGLGGLLVGVFCIPRTLGQIWPKVLPRKARRGSLGAGSPSLLVFYLAAVLLKDA